MWGRLQIGQQVAIVPIAYLRAAEVRNFSRQAAEQKYTVSAPATCFNEVLVAMYVPQTGSRFSSPVSGTAGPFGLRA
jgi:hypothetical protein